MKTQTGNTAIPILTMIGAVILFFGVGFFVMQNRNGPSKNTNQSIVAGVVPPLYVAKRDGVFYTSYDEGRKEYSAPKLFADVQSVFRINTTKDSVFLYAKDQIERRAHNGTLEAMWDRKSSPSYRSLSADETKQGLDSYEQVQVAIYDDGKIYVAANKSLIILDEQLKEVGYLSPLSRDGVYQYKAIDDIMVIDNTAFLVDDIASPLFVFSVDISDAARPTLIHSFGVGGVYGTITNQWFDDASGEWCIQRSTSSGYSGDQYLVICFAPSLYLTKGETSSGGYLGDAIPGMRSVEVGTNNNGSEIQKGKGFAILRDLNHLGDFMLVEERNTNKDYIVGLNDQYKIEAKTSLGENLERRKIILYRYGGHVFLYGLDTLNIFSDDGKNLTGRASQKIDEVDIPNTDGSLGVHKEPAWLWFAADPR
jgi:hypothetical protein